MDENWKKIVERYGHHLGTVWVDNKGCEHYFFGLVYGDDDYYYGFTNMSTGKCLLVSCVGRLETLMTRMK